ncbi:DUF3575 domain-containing protein [Hymenobacter sp. PAMC 26628]|uniref:DUF3575 domain-containing protein n=1 Tax=Hymenobacter sp. PAMC 26628 TaxID=1484118 RepID=UPI000770205E|nr:DUF3575 domain-containing protein [Hymenobacter sp. PAMC 26628]AMJ64971.1 hypothetical protein AXW84_05685 [Hymenobacter sp. PAMC 26628]
MKNFLLLCALAGWVRVASAQDAPRPNTQVVSVGAFGLAPNAGLQYEFRLTKHFSLGVQGARYFSSDYPGYQAALFGRYYFRPAAPAGFYAQGQLGAFWHDGQIRAEMPGYSGQSATRLKGPGFGLGLGYQLLLGQHLALNAGLGLKFYFIKNLGYCDCGYVGDWYTTGQPGSVLDGQLNIGYAF